MKKLALLFIAAFATVSTIAQINVPEKNKTIVIKFTADWCGPCGAGGWVAMNGFVTAANSGSLNAIPLAMHGSSSTTTSLNVPATFRSAMNGNVDDPVTTIPSFVAGRKNFKQSTGSVTSEVATQTAGAVEANAGFMATYDKTKKEIKVDVKTKFFAAASGEYYVAVYAYEDGIKAYQNGYSDPNNAVHGHIWRVDPALGNFGTKLSGSSFTANQEINNSFTMKVDNAWNMDDLHVFTVIWKKNGSNYEVVNANKQGTFPTSVANVSNVANLRVYPNPATSYIKVAAKLKTAGATKVTLNNVVGQTVYSNVFNTTSTDFNKAISVENLANGVYVLNVTVEGVTTSERVLINK